MKSRPQTGICIRDVILAALCIIAVAVFLYPVLAPPAPPKPRSPLVNLKMLSTSLRIYESDYDGRFPLAFFTGSGSLAGDRPDSQSGYALYPYIKNLSWFADPMDKTPDADREALGVKLPTSAAPKKLRDQQRTFNLTLKSNYGFNSQFIHPQAWDGRHVTHHPLHAEQAADPANTLLLINSVWGLTKDGRPFGGGRTEVDAPCIYDQQQRDLRLEMGRYPAFFGSGGWRPSEPNSGELMGGAWPWHGRNGVGAAFMDGHVGFLAPAALAEGCNVKDGHAGMVYDLKKYLWDVSE